MVTDSTAALPPALAAAAGLTVVPLDVTIDGARHVEGVDVTPAQLLHALERGARVTTSQPPPSAFAAAYERAAEAGAREIVSVHLSGEMSGTVRSARTAATVSPVPVRVVDSGTVALGLGFAALAAARCAAVPDEPAAPEPERTRRRRSGPTLGRRRQPPPVWPDVTRVAEAASAVAASTRTWFLVESLEHLRRGGRLSAPAAALGTVLGLRPLLAVQDGRVVVADKVRTRRAARDRLEQVAVAELAARGRVRLGVHHAGDPAAAEALAGRLAEHADTVEAVVADAGAVLGAHAGPGLLAVVVADA